jgi:RNA polymerase sigma-70 factor (ECF subfamily)
LLHATRESEELSDEEIVHRVRGGERALFELLVRRYNQRLFRVTRGVLRHDDDAEEALQEAWVRAFEHLDQFRGESRFATWVTRIAINEALAQRRRRGRLVPLGSDDHDLGAVPLISATPLTPERAAQRAEARRLMETAIEALPESLRVAYVLRELNELDTAETAAALGIPQGTVKVRLHRARRELRGSLEKQLDAARHELYPFLGARCDALTAAVMARVLDSKIGNQGGDS